MGNQKQLTVPKASATRNSGAAAVAQLVTATKASVAAPKKTAEKKAAVSTAPLIKRTAKKGQAIFAIAEAARPGAGTSLFAHTHAALTVLGMLDPKRPSVPQSSLLSLLGPRAVSHHRKELNFESGPGMSLRLSADGYRKFQQRATTGGIDAEKANAYIGLFLDGEVKGTGVSKSSVFKIAI